MQQPVTGTFPVLDWLQIMDSRLLNTTSLRKIEAPTPLGWDSNLFSGITHLILGHWGEITEMPQIQTSQRDFLDALRCMPTLH